MTTCRMLDDGGSAVNNSRSERVRAFYPTRKKLSGLIQANDDEERRWWRKERWNSKESPWLPAIGTSGYPIWAYTWLGAMSAIFPVCKAPGPHSSISEEFLHSTILRPKKPLGSWSLVNLLLSINEAWMDECAARLQPLVDKYKPMSHITPNIHNRKIPRFDRNNPIMS